MKLKYTHAVVGVFTTVMAMSSMHVCAEEEDPHAKERNLLSNAVEVSSRRTTSFLKEA